MATKVKLIADNVITTSQIDTSSLDSHFTGGTGVTYSSGTISIGQAVHSTDSPTFADLTITGNLNITGDINSYNVTDLDVTDQTITLGAGQTEALSGGSGIIVDGSLASILWDETNTEWDINYPLNISAPGTISLSYQRTGAGITAKKWGFHSDNSHTYWQNITDNSLAITLSNSGNLGIGTGGTSPLAKLHVKGNSDDGDAYCQLIIEDTDTDAGSQIPSIQFMANGNNTVRMRGTSTQGLLISGSSAQGDDLVVQAGGVGIGTKTPQHKLDIEESNAGGDVRVNIINSDGVATVGNQAIIHLGNTGSDSHGARLTSEFVGTANTTHETDLLFYTTGSNSVITPQMRIMGSGKVGIGTDDPTGKLHIQSTQTINDGSSYAAKSAPLVIGDTSSTVVMLLDGNQIESYDVLHLQYNSGNDLSLVKGGGNVAIGDNTTPDSKLEIRGSGGGTGLTFKTTDASDNETFFIQDGGRAGVRYAYFSVGVQSANTTAEATANLVVQRKTNSTIVSLSEAASLSAVKIGNFRSDIDSNLFIGNVTGGNPALQGSNDAGTSSYGISLNPFGGNVGIGQTAPQYGLDINGNGNPGGINLSGGNNRIYFSGYRGLEGATDGSSLQVGEGYSKISFNGKTLFNYNPLRMGTSYEADQSLTAGYWYTIAQGSGRCCGDFTLQDGISGGPHGSIKFYVGCSYGDYQNAQIKMIHQHWYATYGIGGIRLRTAGTYDTMYVDVYINRTGTYHISLDETHRQTNNWELVTPNQSPSTSGFTSINLDNPENYQHAEGSGIAQNSFRIHKNGFINLPHQPVFQAYAPSGNSHASYLNFQNVLVNVGGHYSTSTGRFTAPISGNYQFYWSNIANTAATVYRWFIRVNGSNVGAGGDWHLRLDNTSNSGYYEFGTRQCILPLNTNDYVQIYYIADNSSSSFYSTSEYSTFGGYLIS